MKTVLVTGPTAFQHSMHNAIEDILDANFIYLAHRKRENIDHWLRNVDGVILSGGVDIHPHFYGQSIPSGAHMEKFDVERDRTELYLAEYCIATNLPMLGICRGHQVIGVHFGINLIPDLTDCPVVHHPSRVGLDVDPSWPTHMIKFTENNQFGLDSGHAAWANSFHHQAFFHLAIDTHPNLICDAIASLGAGKGRICEAMSVKNHPIFSVQWHPECDWRNNKTSQAVWERFKKMIYGT